MQSNETQEKMFSLIDQWQQSNLTQKFFCEENNIRYYVFHYWYKRYKNYHTSSTEQPARFMKLSVSPLPGSSSVEMVLPDGKRLLFHQPVTPAFLKALIA